jgi:hypothetical protein
MQVKRGWNAGGTRIATFALPQCVIPRESIMSNATTEAGSPAERIEALRLKVKAAVLIGTGLSTLQEYVQELHALTAQMANVSQPR